MTTNNAMATVPESKESAIQKRIENHKKTATHLEKAAKHHQEAAKHYETGDHEKGALSTITAQGHLTIATEAQRENAKRFVVKN